MNIFLRTTDAGSGKRFVRSTLAVPTISDINTTNSIASTQIAIAIHGALLGSAGGSVQITDGTNYVTQTVVDWAASLIHVNAVQGNLKYSDSSTNISAVVTTSGGVAASQNILLVPPAGTSFVTLAGTLYTGSNSILSIANFSGTPAAGCQFEFPTANGFSISATGEVSASVNAGSWACRYNNGYGWQPFTVTFTGGVLTPLVGVAASTLSNAQLNASAVLGTFATGALASTLASASLSAAGSILDLSPPNQFYVPAVTGVALNSIIQSNPFVVGGAGPGPWSISISGGGTYSINGAPHTSAPGIVAKLNNVTVALLSSGQYDSNSKTTLSIGGLSDVYTLTTATVPTMTIGLNVTTRNNMLNQITAAADAQSTAGKLRIYDGTRPATGGTVTNLLAELPLSKPSSAAAAGGVLTFNAITSASSAAATGTATWARIVDASNNFVLDCSVTATGGGGDIQLNSTSISAGQQVSVTSATITGGNP